MSTQCNGNVMILKTAQPLVEILQRYRVTPDTGGIAVAINERIVPRRQWTTTWVYPGDRMEIVHAVQGG